MDRSGICRGAPKIKGMMLRTSTGTIEICFRLQLGFFNALLMKFVLMSSRAQASLNDDH